MRPSRCYAILALAVLLAVTLAAQAPQRAMHIGYVYPAGGKQGTTFEAIIAGQFLGAVDKVYVSGGGVEAKIVEMVRPIAGRELNELRIKIDELLARKAVVRKDFTALEKFRSFKNAKNVKTDSAKDDKELEELKKKYANATWTAEDERMLNEARRKLSGGVRRPANPAISELVVAQVTVDRDAQPGERELRIAAPTGLSNPLVFHVGGVPEFSEKPSKSISQQKSAVAKTAFAPKGRKAEPEMEIALPAVINGQILPGEVDRYRFPAKRGQKLVVAASARDLIPYIADAVPGWFQATLALYDAQGTELAYEDDYRFHPDPVLYYRIPADGQYVVEIKDAIYRGREDFVYRIAIGEMPFVTSIFPLGGPAGTQTTVELKGWNLPANSLVVDAADKAPGTRSLSVRRGPSVSNAVPFAVDTLPECLEKEPNNEPATAQQVTLPVIVNGRVGQPDDADIYCFQGRAGSELVAEVHARRLGSPLDSVLRLTDAAGKQLAFNDDQKDKGAGLTTHHADSYLRATLPADGTCYVHLGDMQHRGGPEFAYRLRLSPPRPDFELRLVPSSINARAGTTFPVTVYALRKDGFAGEIAVALKNAPAGFALSGGLVPAGQDQVRLTLTAPSPAPPEPASLRLEGRATIEGREITHPVVPAEDMIQAFEYRHLVPSQELKVAVAGRLAPKAFVKVLSETPVKIPAGGTARIRLAVPPYILTRVQLALSDPPEGITLQKVSSSDEGAEIVLQSDAAKARPGLKGNLIFTASPRAGGTPAKSKSKSAQRALGLVALPAIPFQIVQP